MAGGLLARSLLPPGFTIPMLGGEAERLNIRDAFFRYRNLEYQECSLGPLMILG
jgi:hypothetical protein